MFRRTPYLFFLLAPFALFGQSKTFSYEDILLNPALNAQNVRQFSWLPGTDQYAYVVKASGKDFLVRGSAADQKRDTLAGMEAISSAVQSQGGEKLSGFPVIAWSSATVFTFDHGNSIYRYDTGSRKAEKLVSYDAEAANTDLEPKTFSVAYTKGNNLYIARKGAAEVMQVTNESNTGIVSGQAAHRSEFGISKGTFWSPTGAALAFTRQDESMVTDYPIMDISTTPASYRTMKYPMAGGKSHHVTIGIYKTWNKTVTYLKTGEPAEQYLTNITWSPDEKFVFVAVVNRGQNEMKLNQYEAATGNFVRTLFTEKNEKWIEPEHGPVFLPGSTEEFLWFSKRDGFQHLYRYDTKGKLLGQVTKGDFEVSDFVEFLPKGDRAIVLGAPGLGMERQAYVADVKKGTRRSLPGKKACTRCSPAPPVPTSTTRMPAARCPAWRSSWI